MLNLILHYTSNALFCIFALAMRDILKILGLLFITSVIFALGNSSEQQSQLHHVTEQLQSQIGEQSPFTQLNIISSRQNTSFQCSRRLCSSHSKVYIHANITALSQREQHTNSLYKDIRPDSISLVFRLHNIRV